MASASGARSSPTGTSQTGTPKAGTSQAGSSGAVPVAVVTGAQQGIGEAIAQRLADDGMQLVVADLHTDVSGDEWRQRWGSEQAVHSVQADVSNESDVLALFDNIETLTGQVPDVLVNNAAVQFWSSLVDLSLADWEATLRVNLTGTFLMTRTFARARIHCGGGGRIVNLGSGCNHLAFPDLVSYTASKGGIEMFTKSSAMELGPHGIAVNCVAPGAIESERTRAETDGYAERWSALTPMRRVGTPEDVARVVSWLCSDGSEFVSGQTVGADGGLFSRAVWPQDY